ncbi:MULTISPECIES: PadR family transcriptional regulator [Halomicrobium]|uniref:Transcriptional regulator, PadR-like family n=2 Tax=Halomicrobium mukohataei TaxID=57705 RepID=C7P137_HALMD|nr:MULTISPECIES: PadR family transcriptional regulator [Halomicrobium]ACV49052.1 transcriptional regulator, PadR-like family [Halomicrobium mukohataei DSM 12286]QCD64472.1 PadR family transcriptional regulator [Halomicrobium mukohataei]QFR19278.1 hypothetical protein GBQ70_02020 [Halomicrobium sp. ZPS1]
MTRDKSERHGQTATESDVTHRLESVLDLTGFQRDVLLVIVDSDETWPSGAAITRSFERIWHTEINRSRVYQNLDKLQEQGFVTTYPIDGRTKGYSLTDHGENAMLAYRRWMLSCLSNDHADATASGT